MDSICSESFVAPNSEVVDFPAIVKLPPHLFYRSLAGRRREWRIEQI